MNVVYLDIFPHLNRLLLLGGEARIHIWILKQIFSFKTQDEGAYTEHSVFLNLDQELYSAEEHTVHMFLN